jgi:hypothetical protein
MEGRQAGVGPHKNRVDWMQAGGVGVPQKKGRMEAGRVAEGSTEIR